MFGRVRTLKIEIAFFSISLSKFHLKMRCDISSIISKLLFGVRHSSENLGTGGFFYILFIYC